MNKKGFTLLEIIIGASITALLLALVTGIYFFYSGNLNKSINQLSSESNLSEFYMNIDSELSNAADKKQITFNNLLGNFKFDFFCYNPYNYINAPILKIVYSKTTDTENLTYSLKKQIFTKTSINSKDEILLSEFFILKNMDDINVEFYSVNNKLNEYFVNTRIDKIIFAITKNKQKYNWVFAL